MKRLISKKSYLQDLIVYTFILIFSISITYLTYLTGNEFERFRNEIKRHTEYHIGKNGYYIEHNEGSIFYDYYKRKRYLCDFE